MNKKHVLLVVRWPVGGIRTFIRYVYRNFDPDGWSFTVIAPEVDEMHVLMADLIGLDVRWTPVKNIPNNGLSGFWKMNWAVAKQIAKKKVNLVHSHGFMSAMCTAFPAYVRNIPHLMTSHETLNKNQFLGFKGNLKLRGMESLFTLIDRVQSVSHDAQDNLLSFFPRLGEKNGRCLVIQSGIEVDRFLCAKSINLRSELQFDDNIFLIGFFGRFMSPKGFHYLIEAVEILTTREKNLVKQPVVITVGEGGFLSREKRLIKKKGLENSFRHMPFSPNIAGMIKGVDVVVMPSLWEACGLLAMETLVCGTPLIASDCIGLREVTKGTPAIKIPIRDSQAIADEVIKLMNKSQKDEFNAFVPEAIERFDVIKQTKSLEKMYLSLVG